MYKEGRISLSRAAELLDKSVYEIIQMAQKRGIEVGASEEQQGGVRKLLKDLGYEKGKKDW
ncbi:MAG: hypothetical protein A7316_04890 [Candidatus Altiarchaeales archaeon WOR_SM1_86-2]|nr:MAG: hypothetical protein A7316_04890 [Candidatus Altiarchaeales archaeon WOR_SM1_86-2]ODS41053.1 MAG: hypothetical protein A7315_15320 [Candidatus Altiarchaeales archaeon WOR_SM1_79]